MLRITCIKAFRNKNTRLKTCWASTLLELLQILTSGAFFSTCRHESRSTATGPVRKPRQPLLVQPSFGFLELDLGEFLRDLSMGWFVSCRPGITQPAGSSGRNVQVPRSLKRTPPNQPGSFILSPGAIGRE